jgi:gamma-glutamyltranspeptidase/glutathione hydrolase
MAPTILLKNGEPFLATGSPGGSMIITTVFQILLNRIDLGMTLPEAIAAPRATQRNTAAVLAEQAFLDSPEASGLRALGHMLTLVMPSAEIGARPAWSSSLTDGCSRRQSRSAAALLRRRSSGRRNRSRPHWRSKPSDLGQPVLATEARVGSLRQSSSRAWS